MHVKGFFLTTLKQGFAQALEEERERLQGGRGDFKPSQKMIGPLRHRLHFSNYFPKF